MTPWGCKEGRAQAQRGAWGARPAPRSGGGPVAQRIVTGPCRCRPHTAPSGSFSTEVCNTLGCGGGSGSSSLRSSNKFIKYIADTDRLRDEI